MVVLARAADWEACRTDLTALLVLAVRGGWGKSAQGCSQAFSKKGRKHEQRQLNLRQWVIRIGYFLASPWRPSSVGASTGLFRPTTSRGTLRLASYRSIGRILLMDQGINNTDSISPFKNPCLVRSRTSILDADRDHLVVPRGGRSLHRRSSGWPAPRCPTSSWLSLRNLRGLRER